MQARVIAVAEKVVRAEIFGVETSILARDLSFDWLGDARERFQVGEHILVRILAIQGDSPETLSIHADVKSVESNTSKENLKNCRVHGKYAGTVEDIHKGTVFVRLELGVNAIAHSHYDSRTVGKKDKVSFVVTILMKNGMLLLASLQGLSNKISDYQKQYEKELTTSISYCDTRYSMLY